MGEKITNNTNSNSALAIETFFTVVNFDGFCSEIKVGDKIILVKDIDNSYDDEAILVIKKPARAKKLLSPIIDTETIDVIKDKYSFSYIANSVHTVIRGTCSAGRLYDKIGDLATAEIAFLGHNFAIAKLAP